MLKNRNLDIPLRARINLRPRHLIIKTPLIQPDQLATNLIPTTSIPDDAPLQHDIRVATPRHAVFGQMVWRFKGFLAGEVLGETCWGWVVGE